MRAAIGSIVCAGLFVVGAGSAQALTFTNSTAITVPGSGTFGKASPYPSTITVPAGTAAASVVRVRLNGLSHTFPDDVDVLLVSPGGQKIRLMADTGGGPDISNVNLTFADAASASLPDSGPIVSGTFKPTTGATGNFGSSDFPSPAPSGPYSGTLNPAGASPVGVWRLYVIDDGAQDTGSISGGWSLILVDTPTATSSVAPAPGTNTATVGGTRYFGGQTLVTVNASDPDGIASIDCKIDGEATASRHFTPASGTPTTFSTTFDFNSPGVRSYSCTATDAAGDTSTPTTGSFVIDLTAPTANATASPSTVNNGPVTVHITATDPSPGAGVASITTSVNGGTATTTAGSSRDLTFWSDGTYTVTYHATDRVGNAGTDQTITVVVDQSAPDGSYNGLNKRTVKANSNATLTGTATDNRGVTDVQVRFTNDSGATRTYTANCPGCGPNSPSVNWSLNLDTLSPRPPSGVYSTEILIHDQAGNETILIGPALIYP